MFFKSFSREDGMHEHMQAVLRKCMVLAVLICVCNMLALACAFCAGAKFAKLRCKNRMDWDEEEVLLPEALTESEQE